jgi:AbiV family abortive infection protein
VSTATSPAGQDKKTIEAMRACVDHARDLLDVAKSAQDAGKPHIAYHLATLALEELGRRELIAVESISSQRAVPPAWPTKHTQDHVQKLFWAFFGANFLGRQLTKESLEEMQTLARVIHSKRLAGLYVESGEDGLSIPSAAISALESTGLIQLVGVRLDMAAAQVPRTDIPDDERETQKWFLDAAEDPERRRYLFSGPSMAKLAELKDARAWVQWLKDQFTDAETRAHAAIQQEFQRSRNLPSRKTRDKWRMRVRILSDSHSIRPKTLTLWNEKSDWIKLTAVSGKKNQLIVELVLGDNVPAEALWFFGWGVARLFVTALNIGTMGFWWWRMPEQISRYYESLEDLDSQIQVVVERKPSLKIDWDANRVLSEEDLGRIAMCLAALPGPGEREKHTAYNFYIGGITFLSLNDVYWQCELQAYGNFHESLKAMMKDAAEWDANTPFEPAFARFLGELFPAMPQDERDGFTAIARAFESKNFQGVVITLKEVSFIKLFCDAYFLRTAGPAAMKARPHSQQETDAAFVEHDETADVAAGQ